MPAEDVDTAGGSVGLQCGCLCALENVIESKKPFYDIVFGYDWTVGDLIIEKFHSDVHNHQPICRNLIEYA